MTNNDFTEHEGFRYGCNADGTRRLMWLTRLPEDKMPYFIRSLGIGLRQEPLDYRLAEQHGLKGWNGEAFFAAPEAMLEARWNNHYFEAAIVEFSEGVAHKTEIVLEKLSRFAEDWRGGRVYCLTGVLDNPLPPRRSQTRRSPR